MGTAALVFAVLSSLGTVAAVVVALIARNDSKTAGKDAAAAAERATVATEKMAVIQSRVFEGPPWEVTWFGGDTYLVTNSSAIDALDVDFDGFPEDVTISMSSAERRDVGARSAVKFLFAPSIGTGFERDIVVRWSRVRDGERFEWSHPIPLKPR